MSRHHYDHIRSNPEFQKLVVRKSRLSWSLAALMMLVYYSFILVIAFFPEWLGVPIAAGSTMTWGMPVGIGIILFTFLITGIYVYRANNTFDSLMQGVINASNDHADQLNQVNEDKN